MSALSPVGPVSALQIQGVTKRYAGLAAVDDVSLDLHTGECLGLLGPNGAGKTTLIRSIVARIAPDSGSIAVFGEPSGSAPARAAIGWVPQELALYPRLTCRENLQTFGEYQGLRGKALASSVEWCLDWAALGDRASSPVRTLSGGMKRRLNMAAGLIHRPRIVLLDEPTVGVDPQSRNRIFEMIEGLRGTGMAIIYTTHYMEEAERLCDRIAIMDHGRVIAMGTETELVQQSFGGRTDVLIHFSTLDGTASEWVKTWGATVQDGAVRVALDRPAEIAPLLESAARAGLEMVDLTLRRPNLESVFLKLTGRDLRE